MDILSRGPLSVDRKRCLTESEGGEAHNEEAGALRQITGAQNRRVETNVIPCRSHETVGRFYTMTKENGRKSERNSPDGEERTAGKPIFAEDRVNPRAEWVEEEEGGGSSHLHNVAFPSSVPL